MHDEFVGSSAGIHTFTVKNGRVALVARELGRCGHITVGLFDEEGRKKAGIGWVRLWLLRWGGGVVGKVLAVALLSSSLKLPLV